VNSGRSGDRIRLVPFGTSRRGVLASLGSRVLALLPLGLGATAAVAKKKSKPKPKPKPKKKKKKQDPCDNVVCPADKPLCCPERCCPFKLPVCCPFACCPDSPYFACGADVTRPCINILVT
jgi:hypothetical protein